MPTTAVVIPNWIDKDEVEQILVDANIDYDVDETKRGYEIIQCENWEFLHGVLAALCHHDGVQLDEELDDSSAQDMPS